MKLKTILKDPFNFLLGIMFIFFAFAFILDTPTNILNGMIEIIQSPDVLITDYFFIGGVGATFVNAAFVGVISIVLLKVFKAEKNGAGILAVWMMAGYSFFGKNILNVLPIIFGGYLYSLYQKKPFKNYIIVIFLSTALSPAVTQVMFFGYPTTMSVFLAILLGLIIGFVICPISAFTMKAHAGYNMYNVGFSAGLVSLFLSAVFRNRGHALEPMAKWSTGYNTILIVFMLTISIALLLGGIFLTEEKKIKKFNIKEYIKNCKTIEDKYAKYGERTYINTGIISLIGTSSVLILGGELNGPIVGGIFTIIAFACLGKNPLNILPPMIGVSIAVLSHGWNLSDSRTLLAMVLCTTLAPISSRIGVFWGVVAGVLHLNIAVRLAEMNSGLSLYNNGLAGGMVAIILVPVIFALKRQDVK